MVAESDFYILSRQYGLDNTTSTNENDSDFYTHAGPNTAPNFLLAGLYYSSTFSMGGQSGGYWSSTTCSGIMPCSSTGDARSLAFNTDSVATDYYRPGHYGSSVRCLAK